MVDKVHYNSPDVPDYIFKERPTTFIDKFIPASTIASMTYLMTGLVFTQTGHSNIASFLYVASFLSFYKARQKLMSEGTSVSGKGA